MRATLLIAALSTFAVACTPPIGGAQVFTQPPGTPVTGGAPATQVQPVPASTGNTAATVPVAQRPQHRAEIAYTQGRLTVKANNSSLNQILREIGRETGIKITGGVAEDRVFGTYGPASPSDVLTKLLDGAGSNMLLIATDRSTPGELVLTPRLGGPTPPNPNAPGFDDEADAEAEKAPPNPRGVTLFGQQPTEQPQAPAAAPATVPVEPAATGTPATTTTSPQSPNGVKTPLEIFQQLQQLRQQQQQQQPPPQEQ